MPFLCTSASSDGVLIFEQPGNCGEGAGAEDAAGGGDAGEDGAGDAAGGVPQPGPSTPGPSNPNSYRMSSTMNITTSCSLLPGAGFGGGGIGGAGGGGGGGGGGCDGLEVVPCVHETIRFQSLSPSVYVRARSSTVQHTSAQRDTARQGEKDRFGVGRNNVPFIQVAVMAAAGIQRPCFAPRVV